jgi:DNA-binding MarR family transcriptional regulator
MTKKPSQILLTSKQLHLLNIVYKFRFTTSTLIAQYRATDKDSLNRTLQKLVDLKYLHKEYQPSWRIDRKPAQYSLTSKAIKLLQEQGVNYKTLHSMYNNKMISKSHIHKCLEIMSVTIALKHLYAEDFHYYTANDLASDLEFPLPRPSLYLNRIDSTTNKQNEYFLELCHTLQPFAFRARFKELLQHYDEEDWDNCQYPTLLFVLETPRQEQAFGKFVLESLDSAGIDDLQVYTSTYRALMGAIPTKAIWTSVNKPESLVSL